MIRPLVLRLAAVAALGLGGCEFVAGIAGDKRLRPDAAADAGADAATDAAHDAAGLEAAVEAGHDAPPVALPTDAPPADASTDAGPITCTLAWPTPAAATTGGGAPTIAHAGVLWGVAWLFGDSVKYNAVDSAGTLQLAADDATPVPLTANVTLSSPHLASFGNSLALAYGTKTGAGSNTAAPVVRVVTVATGAAGSPAAGSSFTDTSPPEVFGLAADATASTLLTSSRYAGSAANAARANLFNATPVQVTSAPASSGARTTAAGFAATAGRYGVAIIEDGSASGGKVLAYDTALTWKGTLPFTEGADAPKVGSPSFSVSIAGGGDHFAVAWVDTQTGGTDVVLTSIDAQTGARVAAGEVLVTSTAAVFKYYPRVVFDDRSLVVTWVEVPGATYRIMLARFDLGLAPIGSPLCASCASGFTTGLGEHGLAAAGPNDYGVVFLDTTSTKQHFRHITCTGP
ncbi:MAG: hypothetical protein HY906_04585 [Deltaproteobacteria bacterium]|nr:hypothetical protein [Deltaproteobacteria bacterium]